MRGSLEGFRGSKKL